MASSHLAFRRFGVFTKERFLDEDTCARLRAEAAGSGSSKSRVVEEDGRASVDEQYRRSRSAELSPAARTFLQERLRQVQSALQEHFDVAFEQEIEAQLLTYSVGDFFRFHRDNSLDPGQPPHIRRRAVSVVVFLNGEATEPEPGSFCGGSLVLYSLMQFPESNRCGLPLAGEQGLLVAFPADTPHRVTPVTFGQRYTTVGWFGSSRVPRLSYHGSADGSYDGSSPTA